MPPTPDPLDLAAWRADYTLSVLDEKHSDPNPFRQLESWLREAAAAGLREPNAMALSTVDAAGQPSGRIVLLKGIEEGGLLFYTSYESRKGHDLAANSRCALTFFWPEFERQLRIEGGAERISRAASEAYFKQRPRGSRLGAIASKQSADLPSRAPLEAHLEELSRLYADTDDIPMPQTWGGYRVTPTLFEFWQGRPNRLHDRIVYRRAVGDTPWSKGRLSP